jgi:dienelactone hydrolase
VAGRIALLAIAAALAGGGACARAAAQEPVAFKTADGSATLNGYLLRPQGAGPHPALVLLHGCTGLAAKGRIFALYRSWQRHLATAGFVAMLVDSPGSRGIGQTCTAGGDRRRMMIERPRDAYAALRHLQAQPFVQATRIGVVGWSQGGATVLNAIAARSSARPAGLAADFRAAVAFYPGRCSDKLQSPPYVSANRGVWTTAVPLLVLLGEADNWTPAAPCAALMGEAKARGASVDVKLYPGAYHVFDAPNMPMRELPAYRLANGVVPLAGTNAAARADALVRVPEFLRRHLRS